MSMNALAADEPSGTTDAPTDDKRVLDLGDVEPASIPGATVIFATAYARTGDGAALRYDGDVPIAAVGVHSEIDAREALEAEYDPANIDRAFAVGGWLNSEKPARAAAVVSYAESGVATDGGLAQDATVTKDESARGCDTCSDEGLADRKCARLPDGSVAVVCEDCYAQLPGATAQRTGYPADRVDDC